MITVLRMMMLLLLMMLQFKTTVLKELCPLSELSLDGDYLLGGLFELYESNNDSDILESSMLEIPVCNSWNLSLKAYHEMEVNPSSSSVQLSMKSRFPSFFRTIPSDKYQMKAIVRLLLNFDWNWVAFLGEDNDYSYDALEVFLEEIRVSSICLAYQSTIPDKSVMMSKLIKILSLQRIKVVVVVATTSKIDRFLEKAAKELGNDMVWIASEAWSMDSSRLRKLAKVKVGTVLGVTLQSPKGLEGLNDFILSGRAVSDCTQQELGCNQLCPECEVIGRAEVVNQDQIYDYGIYAAIYAVAHALHDTLDCSHGHCSSNITVEPYMITAALKKVKFQLYNQTIQFDQNGNPPALYSIVYWNWTTCNPDIIGSYNVKQNPSFQIDENLITWFDGSNKAPVLQCSSSCPPGNKRVSVGLQPCCYQCQSCPSGTYINSTGDPYTCVACQENEWATNSSTSCIERSETYLDFSSPFAVTIMLLSSSVLLKSVAITVLFLYHGNTPVVKSAGGWLCVFMLVCLTLSSVSALLNMVRPSLVVCSLRYPIFIVCFGSVLSCLTVRSFQIILIFKMAARLPRLHNACVSHGGQWVVVTTCTCSLFFLCIFWLSVGGPEPIKTPKQSEYVLDCSFGNIPVFILVCLLLVLLTIVCFLCAYMGIDLPKNYNEGRSITFSLLLCILMWTALLTVYMMRLQEVYHAITTCAILISIYAILIGYFLPKCYIIILKPERNTVAHFQTSIQNYTIQGRR
ncbi:taste receptor type 1 member 1-like isoform X2 [Hypomesus transpacificus]|uniref:taste receptor type 1 member 1-like isoform X2 n=1 Tax=Hypomesus transpacificus TaxID=137520 RepID=UPI001F0744A1|nr:taste receptor type 1 member 1-like isoform X2 [Hypomesus transpacificus]